MKVFIFCILFLFGAGVANAQHSKDKSSDKHHSSQHSGHNSQKHKDKKHHSKHKKHHKKHKSGETAFLMREEVLS